MKTTKIALALAAASMMAFSANAADHDAHDHHMHHGSSHPQVEFTGNETQLENIEFDRCWVRLVPERPSAAYLNVTNKNAEPVTMLGARAENFHDVELHQTYVEDGKSIMAGLDEVIIASNATAEFKPKANHIMLTADSADAVKVGDTITLEFKFEGERVASAECLVKPINSLSFDK